MQEDISPIKEYPVFYMLSVPLPNTALPKQHQSINIDPNNRSKNTAIEVT